MECLPKEATPTADAGFFPLATFSPDGDRLTPDRSLQVHPVGRAMMGGFSGAARGHAGRSGVGAWRAGAAARMSRLRSQVVCEDGKRVGAL